MIVSLSRILSIGIKLALKLGELLRCQLTVKVRIIVLGSPDSKLESLNLHFLLLI
jgi:hypothetical protein